MPFISKEFDYMPPGSFSILPNHEILFRQPLPEELKERCRQDYERLRQETAERNAKGEYSSRDYY